MNPVLVIELVVVVLLIIVFATQIVLPAVMGRPLFPFFREEWKLHRKMEAARQKKVERDLEAKVKEAEQSTRE